MATKVNRHEEWVAENPKRYIDLLETLYAATANPLFAWETMRVVGDYDAEPSVSSIRYFASIADSVIACSMSPRGFAKALDMRARPASYMKQFLELKDPNSKKGALWFAELLVELAERARINGKKTEEDVISDLHGKLGYSRSKIKQLYLNVRKGSGPRLVLSEAENLDAEWAYLLLCDWMLDYNQTL